MARRKKEEPIVHQNRIADEAERLFREKGIHNTTMDDVANAAGYSKATLYVYFKNKDEITAFLTLKSMTILKDTIVSIVSTSKPLKERFVDMGFALNEYAEKYPEYYQLSLCTIQINTSIEEGNFYSKTFIVGEEINKVLLSGLTEGKQKGEFKDIDYGIADVLQIWGMISGIIQMAQQKKSYITLVSNMNKEEFLRNGFEKIYKVLEK